MNFRDVYLVGWFLIMIVQVYATYYRGGAPYDWRSLLRDRPAMIIGGVLAAVPLALNATPMSNPMWGLYGPIVLGPVAAEFVHWVNKRRAKARPSDR